MIKTITNREDYSLNPVLETQVESYNTPLILNGKTWLIQDDYWMKHVHIKVTNACNAKCPFCIEAGAHEKTNWEHLEENLEKLLQQMSAQGHLTTVSITGGEPTLFPDKVSRIINLVRKYNAHFVTMNTNGTNLFDAMGKLDWVDISRHVIGFDPTCQIEALDFDYLRKFKEAHPNTKIRIQCVLHDKGIHNVAEFCNFVKYYSEIADDISIRRLITTDSNIIDPNDLFTTIKSFLSTHPEAEFVEQVLKDYYVYETWRFCGTDITFSHSNMKLLKDMEKIEPDNILREIVVHPDGLIAGSWYKNKKVIFE